MIEYRVVSFEWVEVSEGYGYWSYKFMRLVKAHWSINQNYWKKC